MIKKRKPCQLVRASTPAATPNKMALSVRQACSCRLFSATANASMVGYIDPAEMKRQQWAAW
eukprot:m.27845 g.27845  ORF g.27845 m.27845 type:complete len:62 (-) comp10339_c0_seq1:64-249(-)